MGFFSSISKYIKTPSQMLSTFTSGVKAIYQAQPSQVAKAQGIKLIATPVAFTPTASAVAIPKEVIKTTAKVVTSVAKAVIPKTITGKVAGATAVVIAGGVIKESPIAQTFVKEKIKDIPKAPAKIFEFGEKVGGVIEGDAGFSKSDVWDAFLIAGTAGAVVGAGAYVIPKVIDKFKDKPLTAQEEQTIISTPVPSGLAEKPLGIEGQTPILPETQTITTGKKRYKRRTAKKPMSIRQSVRVNVINRSTSTGVRNTTYLKERLLN